MAVRQVDATHFSIGAELTEGRTAEVLTERLPVFLFGTTQAANAVEDGDIVVTPDLSDYAGASGTYTVAASVTLQNSGDVGVKGTYEVQVRIRDGETETAEPETAGGEPVESSVIPTEGEPSAAEGEPSETEGEPSATDGGVEPAGQSPGAEEAAHGAGQSAEPGESGEDGEGRESGEGGAEPAVEAETDEEAAP